MSRRRAVSTALSAVFSEHALATTIILMLSSESHIEEVKTSYQCVALLYQSNLTVRTRRNRHDVAIACTRRLSCLASNCEAFICAKQGSNHEYIGFSPHLRLTTAHLCLPDQISYGLSKALPIVLRIKDHLESIDGTATELLRPTNDCLVSTNCGALELGCC